MIRVNVNLSRGRRGKSKTSKAILVIVLIVVIAFIGYSLSQGNDLTTTITSLVQKAQELINQIRGSITI